MTQILGVPDGWELVRFGHPAKDDWCLGHLGEPFQASHDREDMWPVIRRIAPICTWQHGVFADGWIAEDANQSLWVYSNRPSAKQEGWVSRHNNGYCMRLNRKVLINPPVFRNDLPWTERIQQVGPTVEAELKEASNAQ